MFVLSRERRKAGEKTKEKVSKELMIKLQKNAETARLKSPRKPAISLLNI